MHNKYCVCIAFENKQKQNTNKFEMKFEIEGKKIRKLYIIIHYICYEKK